MHRGLEIVTLLAAATLAATAGGSEPPQAAAPAPAIACTLDPIQKRERRDLIERELRPHVTGVTELPNGWVLWFDRVEGRLERVARFVALESRCCAFLDFTLRLGSGGDRIALELTGPGGAKEMLRPLVEGVRERSER